jgi:hypothetical protein
MMVVEARTFDGAIVLLRYVAPDGREHFWVVKEKLDRMHREEET